MTLVTQIEQLIDKNGLTHGAQLPTERELADMLGMPRSAVRNALKKLEKSGRIWRHVGRGTFVGARPSQTLETGKLSNPLDETNPAEVLETRLILEPTLAAHAAMRATPSQVERLRQVVLSGDRAETFEEYEHWDAVFHEGVVHAAHNRLCETFYRHITDARTHAVWGRLKRASLSTERRASYQTSHRLICEAISDRDPEAARREMKDHILMVRENMLGKA